MELQRFRSPEEEIAYLRSQLHAREQALRAQTPEATPEQVAATGVEMLRAYAARPHEEVLPPERIPTFNDVMQKTPAREVVADPVAEMVLTFTREGVKRGLAMLEGRNDPQLTDTVHARLVEELRSGVQVPDMKEGGPHWDALHMSLFEISIAREKVDGDHSIVAQIQAMMRFFAGMQGIGYGGKTVHYTIELSVAEGSEDIVLYVSVPTVSAQLFEKHMLSLFPQVSIAFLPKDYNIFVSGGVAHVAVARFKKYDAYPLISAKDINGDPMEVLIQTLTKIEKDGAGASVQFVIASEPDVRMRDTYEHILRRVKRGDDVDTAIQESTTGGFLLSAMKGFVFSTPKPKLDGEGKPKTDTHTIELFERKLAAPLMRAEIRVVTSAYTLERARAISREVQSSFYQFAEPSGGNAFAFSELSGNDAHNTLRAYSFREPISSHELHFSQEELAMVVHLPQGGTVHTAQFKQTGSKRAAAPLTLPGSGTLLGVNRFQGTETRVFVSPEDRLRHFYIIGQTGTGKTTLMKNMVVQDIMNGDGVCMIDPHGTDLADIMGAIPQERYADVIYFDPAYTERSIGLNILEFNPQKPEEKTFVVNELFSIFKKLYSAESMGPMFEQYFRNAALLILDDPESGSTLLDISRVFADAEYRNYKLSKARNPVVVQFWRDIAGKAGGEASLENIVPYITSKIDTFTANDYMRPILGQQQSTFNFREIMDTKKILLVNLSKGRIGEINANLIGMIIVGKFLMAALSRVDDPTRGFPPFYLHMDEFQNISTDSIAQILSEARKYKLGLTVAHQFIAQLEQNIRDAVFGNVGNMAAFRIGPDDAEFLEKQFSPEFSASDLATVENRNAYVRMLANGAPTRPFSLETLPPPPSDPGLVQALMNFSMQRYGRARTEVEEEIMRRYLRK